MRIHDLIDYFSPFTSGPIDPDDVAERLKLAGIRDRIHFVEVNIEVRILRGALHTYVYRDGLYADAEICSDIYYSVNQSRAWKRLVCCKEILHILDNSVSQTRTLEDFEILIRGLCSTPVSGNFDEGLQVWGDRLMVYYASAIVFPWRFRELLLEANLPHGTKLAPIAAQALDIPEQIANLVLSPQWSGLYEAIMGSK
jgi:hypothetical protein